MSGAARATRPGGSSADGIRSEFDLSFAAPPPTDEVLATAGYLRIRVDGVAYAVALEEVAGLVAGRKVVPVPGAFPGLLGVVGYRSSLYPVVALGALLGRSAGEGSRWLFLVRQAEPLALAFDAFEGHLSLPVAALAPGATDGRPADLHALLRGVLAAGEERLPLLDLPSLSREITRRAGPRAPRQER